MSDHHDKPIDPLTARVNHLRDVLIAKGLVDPAALDELVDTYQHRVGPQNGARVVARAWCDDEYKDWLLRDATAAIADMGYMGRQGEHMQVIENTDDVHNVVVCTLCSCYPWTVLGLPPVWYKSSAYRARVVREPRAVLAEFGLTLAADVTVKVWDSTAELRYLVLPKRPQGSESMSQEELAQLISRDAMIGVSQVVMP